jgi:hypothetical protein
MIQNMRLHPFGMHQELTLEELPSFSIIAGPNGSGKGAILWAAALPKYGLGFYDRFYTTGWRDLLSEKRTLAEIDWTFGPKQERLTFRLYSDGRGNIAARTTNPLTGMVETSFRLSESPNAIADVSLGFPDEYTRRLFYGSGYRTTALEPFHFDPASRDIGRKGDGCLHAILYLKKNDPQRLGWIETAIEESHLRIPSLRSLPDTPDVDLIQSGQPEWFREFESMAASESHLLALFAQGVLCEPGDTLLLDEPDGRLDPRRTRGLCAFLSRMANRKVQIVLTTLGTRMIDFIQPGIKGGSVPGDTTAFILARESAVRTSLSRHRLADSSDAPSKLSRAIGEEPRT